MKKLGIIAIIIHHPKEEITLHIQKLLTSYAHIIIGRMGLPDRESNHNLITLIVKGKEDDITSLSDKINYLENTTSNTILTSL